MIYELLHAPFPVDYTETLLPLADCKAHLKVLSSDEDDLIAALRDAAIEFIERYCSVRLGPVTDLVWQAEGFPCGDSKRLFLGAMPVSEVTAISWKDSTGAAVTGTVSDFRTTLHGELLPAIGKSWPSGVGGEVRITFDAGYEEDEAPRSLISAVRMFLGHLYLNREAVLTSGVGGEVPMGVAALCAPFRRISI